MTKEDIKNKDMECMCGHTYECHLKSRSVNYVKGRCLECTCMNFMKRGYLNNRPGFNSVYSWENEFSKRYLMFEDKLPSYQTLAFIDEVVGKEKKLLIINIINDIKKHMPDLKALDRSDVIEIIKSYRY